MIKRIIPPDIVSKEILDSKPKIRSKFFKPDFSQEEKIFEVTQMNNVIDIMNSHPKYQQAILSNLPPVEGSISINTSIFSDSQLAETCVERQFDDNEIMEFVEKDLNQFKNK